MKRWLCAVACAALGACAGLPRNPASDNPVSAPGGPADRTLLVNGQSMVFSQITDSTWTGTAPGRSDALPNTADSVAALRQAVENISGCLVTDSDFARQGRQFDAQVDCSRRSRP